MNDSYTTDHAMFCGTLCYIFGNEALIEIKLRDFKPEFTLDAPSLDCAEYLKEYLSGNLAVADAKSLFASYSMVLATIREMRANKWDSWRSKAYQSSWCNGKHPDGRRIK